MKRFARNVVCLLAVPLPQRLKRGMFERILGWEISADAYIGMSYVNVDHVVVKAGAYIGHFNVIRQARLLHLGGNAYIKDFNHIFGCPESGPFVERSFTVGEHSLIMSRHFFDVSGRILIGKGCTIGGRGTQIWSHSLVSPEGVPRLEPREMIVGDGVYIGARALLVHCNVPDRATVAAGAVLTKSYEADDHAELILAGNPAVIVRRRSESDPEENR